MSQKISFKQLNKYSQNPPECRILTRISKFSEGTKSKHPSSPPPHLQKPPPPKSSLRRSIRLFRIISILSKSCYFRLPDHVISIELLALNFRCQCTQQKLQSIYAVLTFDPQVEKNLNICPRK